MREPMAFDKSLLSEQGYASERLKSGEVFYSFDRGVYADIASSVGLIPEAAPECAAGVLVVVIDEVSHGAMVAAYMEGRECGALSAFGNYQQHQIKHTAYELLGLK